MLEMAAVAGGAFFGGAARYVLSKLNRPGIFAGTFSANVAACFVVGAAQSMPHWATLLLTTGLAGALSTMSTYVKELKNLTIAGAALYFVLTTACGGVALWAGVQTASYFA